MHQVQHSAPGGKTTTTVRTLRCRVPAPGLAGSFPRWARHPRWALLRTSPCRHCAVPRAPQAPWPRHVASFLSGHWVAQPKAQATSEGHASPKTPRLSRALGSAQDNGITRLNESFNEHLPAAGPAEHQANPGEAAGGTRAHPVPGSNASAPRRPRT